MKIYFIVGSQDLYGEQVLKTVAEHAGEMADFLNGKLGAVQIEALPVVRNSGEIVAAMQTASCDADCAGVIIWAHTFSPAKMWIKGLKILSKPLCHLHTQYNERLPYADIDMDFMNLNQSAHGDRELSFILARMRIPHYTVAGYYKNQSTVAALRRFAEVANAIAYSQNLKVAMFGGNMREVAVTDGDRVESQIRYGWEVNYYGIGNLTDEIALVTDAEADMKMQEYSACYTFETEDICAVREQAKYEIALSRFLEKCGANAFTDTFQDLHGLSQLPGLAVQRLMNGGVGFAAEGDYKTAALCAVLSKLAENREGATGFMEDYTYDLVEGEELVLASHMLEVSEAFAKSKPSIRIEPLSIGGKNPPARLVFDAVTGSGVAVCMTDMGDRFRLIAANIELVQKPAPMPKLPVAGLMWRLKPDFKRGAQGWLEAGGGHHTVVSTALDMADIELFARLTGTELITIG